MLAKTCEPMRLRSMVVLPMLAASSDAYSLLLMPVLQKSLLCCVMGDDQGSSTSRNQDSSSLHDEVSFKEIADMATTVVEIFRYESFMVEISSLNVELRLDVHTLE